MSNRRKNRRKNDHTRDHACPYCSPEKFEGLAVPQSQGTLNNIACEDPDCPCSHLDITGEHTDGFDAEYCKRHGILTLLCRGCGGLVDTFYIAEKLTMVPSKTGPYLLEPKGNWNEVTA